MKIFTLAARGKHLDTSASVHATQRDAYDEFLRLIEGDVDEAELLEIKAEITKGNYSDAEELAQEYLSATNTEWTIEEHEFTPPIVASLVAAIRGLQAAHDSYSKEFNPSGKIRGIADWGLINDAFLAATAAIAKAEGTT